MAANFMELSKEQAEEFAYEIFTDIEDYIKTHLKEYEEFLKSEDMTEGGENNE